MKLRLGKGNPDRRLVSFLPRPLVPSPARGRRGPPRARAPRDRSAAAGAERPRSGRRTMQPAAPGLRFAAALGSRGAARSVLAEVSPPCCLGRARAVGRGGEGA